MTDSTPNVPKEFLRNPDPHLLPPRVGHNWNDQAFRKNQKKPQQLEAELRGKRAFVADGVHTFTPGVTRGELYAAGSRVPEPPTDFGEAARQLMQALSSTTRGQLRTVGSGFSASANSAASRERLRQRYLTLDDKVLRFYAYFREPAPEGGANDFWHRRVIINVYPVDDTIRIEEPVVPNSGMAGGTFLKRQKVKADPRQREQWPQDEFVTLNAFQVGESVRLNAHEFVLYDCDGFTREFLTSLGVVVGEPMECPDDELTEACKRHEAMLLGAKHGVPATWRDEDREAAEAESAARFVRDGGKTLFFHGLLDERGAVESGIARHLEFRVFVEDNSVSMTEVATTREATPALFLSRCFLPRSGSLTKANECTFAHRVNGQRQPDVGPEGTYTARDFGIGVTINVLGRPVFIYDCDNYTRDFYRERYGVELQPGMTKEIEANFFSAAARDRSNKAGREGASGTASSEAHEQKVKDELRFRLVLCNAKDHFDQRRRFTLTYYTDTNEVTLYEVDAKTAGSACLLKKQPLRKPTVPRGPRNDPVEKQRTLAARANSSNAHADLLGNDTSCVEFYQESDFHVGAVVAIGAMTMRIIAMDAHSEKYFTRRSTSSGGAGAVSSTEAPATVQHLLEELRRFLDSRYGTAVKAFLAMDGDRDGVISPQEFLAALRFFQITDDAALGRELLAGVKGAGTASTPGSSTTAHVLTAKDLMRWMGEGQPTQSTGTAESVSADGGADSTGDEESAIAARAVQRRVLTELRERLTARQITSVGMFRLASTMPRAYRDAEGDSPAPPGATMAKYTGDRISGDVYTLTNPDKDARITPVQLRRCCEEILGTLLTPDEMASALGFFYPDMPAGSYFRSRDDGSSDTCGDIADYAVDLPTFQQRFNEMCKLAMLPENNTEPNATKSVKTSLI